MTKTAQIARTMQALPCRPTYANRVGGGLQGLVHLPTMSVDTFAISEDRRFGSLSLEAVIP